MIPRPFDRPKPAPIPEPAPIITDSFPATILEIVFPSTSVTLTLFDGDSYEMAGEAIKVEYVANPRIGRTAETFLIFRSQAYYLSERKVVLEIAREPFTPSELTGSTSQAAVATVTPDEADQPDQ